MTYFRLRRHDEFGDDGPGVSIDQARGVILRIYERNEREGRREILADPVNGKNYLILLEHPEHAQMLRALLERHNIWFEEHEELPRPKEPPKLQPQPQDATVGVIFFLLSREQVQPAAVRGVVHGIAASLNEMTGGEFRLRAQFLKDDDDQPETYWVGFNDETAGAIFLHVMREQGVTMPHARTMPGGRRPQLQVVDYDQSAQLAVQVEATTRVRAERKRRKELADPELPPLDHPAMAQGGGFAVVKASIRKALNNPAFKKRMEERFGRRKRPEIPEIPRLRRKGKRS